MIASIVQEENFPITQTKAKIGTMEEEVKIPYEKRELVEKIDDGAELALSQCPKTNFKSIRESLKRNETQFSIFVLQLFSRENVWKFKSICPNFTISRRKIGMG